MHHDDEHDNQSGDAAAAPDRPRPGRVRDGLKRVLIGVLKYGISLSILAYLFYHASQDDSFAELQRQPKQWGLLAGAFLLTLTGVLCTMVRWHILVRALNLKFSLRDAFRLGFLGYLFNFLTLGVVGGDALKAVSIAREQHGRRAEAVATVVVDRIIGLYALFLLGSVAFMLVDLQSLDVRDPGQLDFLLLLGRVTCGLTLFGAVGLGLLLLPGFTTAPFWDALVKIPRIGGTLEQLIAALRMYRKRLGLLFVTLLMSVATHTLLTISVYLIARGLPGAEPPLGTHFIVVPIASVAGALPLPGGIGPFEYTLDLLYRTVSSVDVAPRQGFIVAMAQRVVTLLIALIGVIYYLASRREVASLLKEAETPDADEYDPRDTYSESVSPDSEPRPAVVNEPDRSPG